MDDRQTDGGTSRYIDGKKNQLMEKLIILKLIINNSDSKLIVINLN